MVDEHYSKTRIIGLVKEHNHEKFNLGKYAIVDEEAYESHEKAVSDRVKKQLERTLKFLNEERVKKILGLPKEGRHGDYFYSREMNHSNATGGAYDAYDFNYLDAMFLGVLVSLFDNDYLSKIRNNAVEKASLEEELYWIKSYKNELEKFVGSWVESEEVSTKQTQLKLGSLKFNIESLLYKITLISQDGVAQNSKRLNKKQGKLNKNHEELRKFLKDYLSLPIDDQMELYGKGIETRINFMQNIVTERIKSNEEKRINGLEIDFANEMKKVNDRKAYTQKLENRINEISQADWQKYEKDEFKLPSKHFTQRLDEIDNEIINYETQDDLKGLLDIYNSDENL